MAKKKTKLKGVNPTKQSLYRRDEKAKAPNPKIGAPKPKKLK